MNTTCIRGCHLSLRDQHAPYRGEWMICADSEGSYWALHDTAEDSKGPEVVEECSFSQRDEASRFIRHLMLHGWTVVEFSADSSSIGLLW